MKKFFGLVPFIIFLMFFSTASSQLQPIELDPGQSVTVVCSGDELLVQRPGVTVAELDCVAPPTPTPTSTATSTPAPTATPTPTATPVPSNIYHLPFTGFIPAAPQTYMTTGDLSVAVHYRNASAWYSLPEQMADHGADCAGPPAEHPLTGLPIEASVYTCRQHIMTSLKASGYGMVSLTPAAMLDWSNGEAVLRFDMSTVRVSGRDWIDIWLTPYDYNLIFPHKGIGADLNGPPLQAARIQMRIANSGDGMAQFSWRLTVFDGANEVGPLASGFTPIGGLLPPSRTTRTTFELRVSSDRVTFGVPDYNYLWVDEQIALPFDVGIVQITQHSYNPDKACANCGNATWHWDNIYLSPAVPFTIIGSTPYSDGPFTLAQPAPAGAHVRASINGTGVQVRFDGGPWQVATLQVQGSDTNKARAYWMPVPEGTQIIEFIGSPNVHGFNVRAVEVWAQQE